MRHLLVYLKDYKKESVFAPLFKMLEASFDLLVPLVMAAIIDNGIAGSDIPYILKMGLVLIALGLIGLTCSITAQFFAAKAAVGFSTKLRHSLFSHIQSLSFTELDSVGTSTLITRLTSDCNYVQGAVNMSLRLFLRSPFIVVGAMVLAFTIDFKAALIFVAVIVLLCIVVFGIMLITIPMYRDVQNRLDQVLRITRENLSGVRVIRAFNKEQSEIDEFEKTNGALAAMQLFVGKISALTNPVTYIIVNGATIALLWTGAIRVDTGVMTQGQVVALVNYMSQILVELVKLANLIVQLTKALACADRIQKVFEMKPSMENGSLSAADKADNGPFIEFDHVSLTYTGAGETSLHDISFRVNRGETVGIIGGTGSGKSSLVHLIPRFYDATEGQVRIGGVDVKEYNTDSLRQKIGMVMQKAVLFKGTVRDNIRWGKKDATDEEIKAAIHAAQADDFIEERKEGLDAKITQEGRNLSGGQKQRLSIARALVRNPEILILDDSSSALDFATDARLRRAIRELAGSHTVFIVSQRTSSIHHADRILVLEDGHLVGNGTHEELLESNEVYQEIHYSQFPKEERA